jgi:hypothetical protein
MQHPCSAPLPLHSAIADGIVGSNEIARRFKSRRSDLVFLTARRIIMWWAVLVLGVGAFIRLMALKHSWRPLPASEADADCVGYES